MAILRSLFESEDVMHRYTIPVVLIVSVVFGFFPQIRELFRYFRDFGLPDGGNVMDRLVGNHDDHDPSPPMAA